jgi:glycosyltransferase involved in cell wall biosynthesis
MSRNKRPRLILVTEYFTPANNAPGARFGPLAQAFKKYFNIIVFTSTVSRGLVDFQTSCNLISFPGNTKSLLSRLIFEILFSVETFCRLLFSRADIYYITSPSFFNCIFSFFYCYIFSKKYIVDIRDDYPRVFFDNNLIKEKSIIGKFFLWLEKRIYKHAYMVVAATEGLRQCINEK